MEVSLSIVGVQFNEPGIRNYIAVDLTNGYPIAGKNGDGSGRTDLMTYTQFLLREKFSVGSVLGLPPSDSGKSQNMATTTESETTVQIEAPGLDESDRHRLLADERRRVILELLEECDTSLSLAELVADIDARVSDEIGANDGSTDDIQIMLHHVHLPMMADLGVVNYDAETNRIDPR